MNQKISHPFAKRFSQKKLLENCVLNLLRLSTYLIILFAGYIFLDIGINGSKAVFKAEAPFINLSLIHI